MRSRDVQLAYSFQLDAQRGAAIRNPLFELLSALREGGSIQHAAKAIGASYRHVWGALKQWEMALGEPLVTWAQGQPARLTPFAERLLCAETRARIRMTPHIEALRAELERVLIEALDGSQQTLTLHASHDPALAALREHASLHHSLHIDWSVSPSMDALRDLAEERCMVAAFQVPLMHDGHNRCAQNLKSWLHPDRHRLIGHARRSQGLIVARGNPLKLRTLADLATPPMRFVNRPSSSGTRLWTDHLLAEQGLDPAQVAGYFGVAEGSHVAAAFTVACGAADATVGIAAAAQALDLDFVPLFEEDCFLVCLQDTLELPAVRKLREALRSPACAEALAKLAGYSPSRPGEVLPLARALPWWSLTSSKQESGFEPVDDPA